MQYREVFQHSKPIIGMLHLKDDEHMDMLKRAQAEADCYRSCGVDALLVENYFGSTKDCEIVLRWLQKERPTALYGVNILGQMSDAFELCNAYGGKFVQIDSVSGHIPPNKEQKFFCELEELREGSTVAVLGGVRFKYQPMLSQRTLAEDLTLGMEHCDAIVVTGEGTGMDTPIEKIKAFRQILGDFPLVVGAGVTANTAAEITQLSDGMIVGSYFKEGHQAHGDVNMEYVRDFVALKCRM